MAIAYEHGPSGANLVKLFLTGLRSPEDDWPPYDAESVWVRKLGPNSYLIDNSPWFARGIAFGDTVRAHHDDALGGLVFDSVSLRGGHSNFRTICTSDQTSCDRALQDLKSIGCAVERWDPTLAAIDVPPGADVEMVLETLERFEERGILGYEEGYRHVEDPR